MSKPSSPEQRPEPSAPATVWMDFASLGLTFAIVLGGFLALGLWLDSIWHTSPIFLFVGIVLGLVVAVISTVNIVRRHL